MESLYGKVALVTGAAGGIGRATALALAAEGARLVLCDIDEAGLAQIETEVSGRSSCLLALRVDVSVASEVEQLAREVHAFVPALDIVVNNAGVGLAGGLLDTSLDDWKWVLGPNLWGVIHGCHYFAPAMARAGRGHIVNVASAFGLWGAPGAIGYVTSKFAVVGLSEALRAELAPCGVAVSAICPGAISTNILAAGRFLGGDAEARRREVMDLYARRNGRPEKVADAIVRALRNEKAVVPVTTEAHAMYWVKRLVPGLGDRIGKVMAERAERQRAAR